MIDVKELLRRWSAGHSNRKIARETGADRATVGRYIEVVRELGLERGHEFTDAEVHEVAQRVQARPVRDATAEWTAIAKHKERIVEWLGRKRPLKLTKIHTLLVREHSIEASYDTLAVQFGHDVAERVPLVVYASHTDFEQTNILPFTPPEGLLGATDFLKRRVSLPFRGNFSEFRHTLRHEMVHVFQLDLLSEAYLQSPRHRRFDFPLWWTEGLAELWSSGQDARDDMVLRDLTLSGRLPTLRQLTWVISGIVYPLGGQIHRWLADTYGDWRVATMYKEQNRHDSFDAAIKAVYGRSLDQRQIVRFRDLQDRRESRRCRIGMPAGRLRRIGRRGQQPSAQPEAEGATGRPPSRAQEPPALAPSAESQCGDGEKGHQRVQEVADARR